MSRASELVFEGELPDWKVQIFRSSTNELRLQGSPKRRHEEPFRLYFPPEFATVLGQTLLREAVVSQAYNTLQGGTDV